MYPSSAALALTIPHVKPLLNFPPCPPNKSESHLVGRAQGSATAAKTPDPSPGLLAGPTPQAPAWAMAGTLITEPQAFSAPTPGHPELTSSPECSSIRNTAGRGQGTMPIAQGGFRDTHKPNSLSTLYTHTSKPHLHSEGPERAFCPPSLASICQNQLFSMRLLTPFCTT